MQKEIEHKLDLSYYSLGNAGMKALVPHLKAEVFLGIKQLDISYNNLNDEGIDAVVQALATVASPIEELNISGNKVSDGQIGKLADHIKHKMKSCQSVIMDGCNVSEEARNKLKLSLAKAERNRGNAKLNQMYAQAKHEDEAQLSEGYRFD